MAGKSKFKDGGGVEPKRGEDPGKDVYAGEHSNVEKEAEEKNTGGRVKRKTGGRTGLKMSGATPMHSINRPGRKRGGGTGAELRPLTGAAHGKDAGEHKTGDTGDAQEEP